MSLEKIVRPFQTGDVFKPRTMPPSQPGAFVDSTDLPTLSWVGGTDGDYTTDPAPFLFGQKPDDHIWDEDKTQRQTETVRVENPDDPDQYVEIERIKQSVFRKRSTGEQIQMGINWDDGRS